MQQAVLWAYMNSLQAARTLKGVIMDLSNVLQFTLHVLEYVLPAVFVWNLTDVIVKAIVGAATGRKKDGI